MFDGSKETEDTKIIKRQLSMRRRTPSPLSKSGLHLRKASADTEQSMYQKRNEARYITRKSQDLIERRHRKMREKFNKMIRKYSSEGSNNQEKGSTKS